MSDDSERWNQAHGDAVETRNQQVSIIWVVNNLYLTLHVAGIGFVVSQLRQIPTLYFYACLFGVVLAVIWIFVIIRMWHWLDYFNQRIISIETVIPEGLRLLGGTYYEELVGKWWGKGFFTKITAFAFLAVWLLLLIDAIRIQYTTIQSCPI